MTPNTTTPTDRTDDTSAQLKRMLAAEIAALGQVEAEARAAVERELAEIAAQDE